MKRTLFYTVLATLALAACVDSNRDNNGGRSAGQDDGRILQLLVAVAPFNVGQLTIRNLDILHVIKAERAWKREKCRFRPRIPLSIC